MIETVEMHTGGEPVRIITGGYPYLEGATLLDKRRYAKEHFDHLRRLLMLEPRGHYDMYGALLVEPDHPDAALAVLFMPNEGYSTMCGHAAIALGRYAADQGIVEPEGGAAVLKLQVPSGLVVVTVDAATGGASYRSVPSFLAAAGVAVSPAGLGTVTVDVAYGGAYYALATAADLDVVLEPAAIGVLRERAAAVTAAVAAVVELDHPDAADLGFLYGTIVTDGVEDGRPSTNVCVFADAQVDRSPTGSGVQARLAAAHAKGLVELGEQRTFRSIVGSEFTGSVAATTSVGDRPAVVTDVGGRAFYTGTSFFSWEEDDDLGAFALR